MPEDVWIPSACNICYSNCGIKVRRTDGTVVKIEGNPDNPVSAGRICGKGQSGVMLLYDPDRVNYPLKRTNPEKGIGIDPKWERIGWDEALDLLTEKMRRAMEKDPRSIIFNMSAVDAWPFGFVFGLMAAFKTPNWCISGAGSHCGNGEHVMAAILHGAIHTQVDYDLCNYLIMFGCGSGAGMYYNATLSLQKMADAKSRGMKIVVFDPLLSPSAERADEWVPIKPGTDAYAALAMMNVLINELGLYDAEHIAQHTNGPYLIGPDGKYVRDKKTKKPLVWDPEIGEARPYDAGGPGEPTLLGTYTVEGVSCRPSFHILKDHVMTYTPEGAEKVCDVRADTLRRITREFGEAARIGSTIEIEGHHLPYRPVGVLYFKGSQAHRHCLLTSMALSLLPEIVGAADTPGGLLGSNPVCLGHPETGRPSWGPSEGPDSLLITGSWLGTPPSSLNEPAVPSSITLGEISPMGVGPTGHPFVLMEPEKFALPYKPDVMVGMGSNLMMTFTNPKDMEKALKAVPFTAYFSLYLDEITEFADLVLPETCYLERYDIPMVPMLAGYANSAIIKEWSYYIRQPAVEPLYERRPKTDVMLEVVHRLNLWEDFTVAWNASNQLVGEYALRADRRYSYEEMLDYIVRCYFGEKHNLEWFKEHGFIKWKKKPEESYWKQFMPNLRIPLYFEWFLDMKEKSDRVKEKLSYGHLIDTSDYQAVPDWKPCPSHLETQTEFDLYAFYYRVPIHTFGSTYNIGWLDDVSQIDPQVYNLTLHPETARQKGIKTGDWVEVESQWGGKLTAKVHLTEGIRPDCLAMANCGGHWSKRLSIASRRGRGACFEHLMKTDWDLVDWTVHNWDLCVKVKVTGISEEEAEARNQEWVGVG